MSIDRYPGQAVGRSAATAFKELVFAVATAPDGGSLAEQARAALVELDRRLALAGSDRQHLLSVTIYVADIESKGEVDAVWNEWLGPAGWPQRACIGAQLPTPTLVEVTAIAVRNPS